VTIDIDSICLAMFPGFDECSLETRIAFRERVGNGLADLARQQRVAGEFLSADDLEEVAALWTVIHHE